MKTDSNSKGTVTFFPANSQVNVAALDKDGKFAIGITANIKDPNGLVLVGAEITLTPESGKAITFDVIPEQTTDNNGNTTFNVTGSLTNATNPYNESVSFTLADAKQGLSASGVLSFIGQLPV